MAFCRAGTRIGCWRNTGNRSRYLSPVCRRRVRLPPHKSRCPLRTAAFVPRSPTALVTP
jgi:hypothetical protein